MEELYGDQVVFLQVNKDKCPELLRKYGAHRFPSFYYVKPGTLAKVATRFSGDRDYDELKKWMVKLVTVHGGVALKEDDEAAEEIQFHSDIGDDDDEDDMESEPLIEFDGYDIKKLQEENKKKQDHDHDHHDHDDQYQTEIVSITDAETGENIEFKIDDQNTINGNSSSSGSQNQMNLNLDAIVGLKKIKTKLHNHVASGSEISVLIHQQAAALVKENDKLMEAMVSTIDKLTDGQKADNDNSGGGGMMFLIVGGFVIGNICGVIFVATLKKSLIMTPKVRNQNTKVSKVIDLDDDIESASQKQSSQAAPRFRVKKGD